MAEKKIAFHRRARRDCYYIASELEKLESPEKAVEKYKQALESNPDKLIALSLHQNLAKALASCNAQGL